MRWVFLLLAVAALQPRSVDAQVLPEAPVTLWLWHGAHDLRGLAEAAPQVSVAYLAQTHILTGRGITNRWRQDPIHLDDGTTRTAVVHIEVTPSLSASEAAPLLWELVASIAPLFQRDGEGVQLDFDAPLSFRPFYLSLLHALDEVRPADKTLSMTAIGSWCLQDRWLVSAPVAYVVPMLFGPGHARNETLAALRQGPLPEPMCNMHYGVRDGQGRPPREAPLFVFRQGPWTLGQALHSVMALRSVSPARR